MCTREGGCIDNGERCIDNVCRSSNKFAGESCQHADECLSKNCFSNLCSCDKRDSKGCPGGHYCDGGSHATWGTTCLAP